MSILKHLVNPVLQLIGEDPYVSASTRAEPLPISFTNETVALSFSNFPRHLQILHSQFNRDSRASVLKPAHNYRKSRSSTERLSARTLCCNAAAHASL